MKRLLASTLLASLVLMNACQKETSFETGGDPSEGTLGKDGSGDCAPMTVTGAYVEGTALDGNTNQILLDVDVTTTGSYTIYTDTVNGVSFKGTGTFPVLGNTAVTLKGAGTPLGAGPFNFNVIYNDDTCTVSIPFLPASASGPAEFTFTATGGNCSVSNQTGSYMVNTALTTANTITIAVNVTTIGTYTNITTTAGGMTFSSGPGAFTATGPTTVVLTGTGTAPAAAGPVNFTLIQGTSTCNFSITVASGNATGTLSGGPTACAPVNIGGTYTVGTAFVSGTHKVEVQVNVATTGAYTINATSPTTTFTFSGTGNFTTTGLQMVTLNAQAGPPNTQGNHTFTVTFGTSTCTFVIPVAPAPSNDYFPRTAGSNWSYELDDDANDSLFRRTNSTIAIAGNTYNIFAITDDASAGYDSSGYYRKSGGSYYEWIDVGTNIIGFDNPQWAEYIFLKDDVPQGTSWNAGPFTGTATIPPNAPQTFAVRLKFTIDQKNVPITIMASTGNIPYTNVIVVKEEYEVFNPVSGQYELVPISGKSFYAPGVGLIKYEFYDGSTLDFLQELRRHMVY